MNFIAALESGAALDTLETAGGGVDWSSFWPDMLVAALTTGGFAYVVLKAERRMSERNARREVWRAQIDAMDIARLLLDQEVSYEPAGLAPNSKNLRRLRKVIANVPAGAPDEYVPAYRFAKQVAVQAEAQEIHRDVIEQHLARYTARTKQHAHTEPILRRKISGFASVPRPDRFQAVGEFDSYPWAWTSSDDGGVPPSLRNEIESDRELNQAITGYIHTRQLLSVYREAFVKADVESRSDAWKATLAAYEGAPNNVIKKWWRERRRRKSVAASDRLADQEAQRLVEEFDPYAY